MNIYLSRPTGKYLFLQQLEKLRNLIIEKTGIELSDSKIIVFAVNELLKNMRRKNEKVDQKTN